MANPFTVASFNLINWAKNIGAFFSSTPQTVVVPQMDESGNVTDYNIQNRGMFQQAVWDDVGGALGQFDRTFYVDAENGSDTNDGSTGSPFKTLQKAFDSVPIGGKGTVSIRGKYVNTARYTDTGDNKAIYIYVDDNDCYEAPLFDYNDTYIGIPSIIIGSGTSVSLYFSNSDNDIFTTKFEVTNPDGVDINKNIAPYYNGLFAYHSEKTGTAILNIRSRVNHSDSVLFDITKGYLFFRYNWNADAGSFPILTGGLTHHEGKFAILRNGAKLMNIYKSGAYNPQGAIVDENGDGVAYKDAISGVVHDADSGNPVNVLSNINISN